MQNSNDSSCQSIIEEIYGIIDDYRWSGDHSMVRAHITLAKISDLIYDSSHTTKTEELNE